MLEGVKVGDRVINNLGEEASVTRVQVFNNRRFRLFLGSPITGWISKDQKTSWVYDRDGKFVRDSDDQKASDLVKVIKHD